MPDSTPYRRGLTRLWKPRSPLGFAPAADAPLLTRILACRGLTAEADVRAFVDPSLLNLHDPSLIPDLDRAAERMLTALTANQPIAIYGDYDVDGVTATAILYHTCRTIAPGADVRTYVPHRLDEGYGLNAAAIEQLAAEGAKVIVSVDCGITAIEPALAARRAGVDLIITDHHNPPKSLDDLPRAYAVVHPRRPDSAYPFGDLSGAGVAYKLAWRLATLHCGTSRVNPPLRALLIELLSFAALGAIADIVPLVGENRVLTRHGLARMKHSPNPGLRALVVASGLAGDEIDSDHVGFALGPRLNACGRMGHAREAVELFTTATPDQAAAIAARLCTLNDQRRATERSIADAAAETAERCGMASPDRRAIVLADEHWHAGVIGIVCSRLVERFHRPAILLQVRDGVAHGSGRSVEGLSLHTALESCADLLTSFGGHDMAAGLKLDAARLPEFTERFTAYVNERIPPDRLVGSVSVDCDATLDELTMESVAKIEALAPFGMGNPRPRICLSGLRVDRRPECFGAGGKHLAVQARQGQRWVRMVAWNWGARRDEVPVGSQIDAVVSPKVSGYSRQVEPELADLRIVTSS
jgi:single-stranded-DNA-specific exonuclease